MENQLDKKYFPALDFARFFAAFSVLCFHYFSVSAKNVGAVLKTYIENGFLGVQLFFMISGFVIFFSLQDGLKKYTASRLLRLYPIFWFCCTLTYLTTVLFSNDALPLSIYLKNLLILNDGKTAHLVDGSYWTLTHEIIFYGAIGVFVYFFGKKNVVNFFYLWFILLTAGIFFNMYNTFIFKVLLVRSGFYFIFGGLLANLISQYKKINVYQKTKVGSVMFFSVIMPFVLSQKLISDNPQVETMTNRFGVYTSMTEILMVASLYFIIVLAALFPSKYIKGKVLNTALVLGGITYPLYLLHHKIGAVFIDIFAEFGKFNIVSIMFTFFILGFSYVVYVYDKRLRQICFEYLKNKKIL